MIPWPWTNLKKELDKRSKDLDSGKTKTYTFEEVKDYIYNYKPTKFERAWNKVTFAVHELTWSVYRLFKPCHVKIRNSIPKRWCDLTELTLIVNFEIIKSFVEQEMHHIDWEHTKNTKEAAAWLNSSYKYITEERKELEKELELAYSAIDNASRLPYEEKYKDVIRIEEQIEDTDKKILIGLANNRGYLWS